jgi:hypothetical protein
MAYFIVIISLITAQNSAFSADQFPGYWLDDWADHEDGGSKSLRDFGIYLSMSTYLQYPEGQYLYLDRFENFALIRRGKRQEFS